LVRYVLDKSLSFRNHFIAADKRVLAGTNILSNITNPADLQVGPKGANYIEQIQWQDADTDRLLAASDYFSPMIVGMQVCAGYGGVIYEGLNDGHIMASQVTPALKTSGNSTARKNS
jgi:hypothetical protein